MTEEGCKHNWADLTIPDFKIKKNVFQFFYIYCSTSTMPSVVFPDAPIAPSKRHISTNEKTELNWMIAKFQDLLRGLV